MFDFLTQRTDDWLRQMLSMAKHGSKSAPLDHVDLTYQQGFWGPRERGLLPPLALLSWLIRNLEPSPCGAEANAKRAALMARDPETIESALRMLRGRKPDRRRWYVLEGPTYPDAVIETPGAMIVVEGKRTEAGPTTCTTWKADRHQIWRHMDAAWEIRGGREVYGLFLVEGTSSNPDEVPLVWKEAAQMALDPKALAGSFPHRSEIERNAIISGFLGVATWQSVCARFGKAHAELPNTASEQLARRKRSDRGEDGPY